MKLIPYNRLGERIHEVKSVNGMSLDNWHEQGFKLALVVGEQGLYQIQQFDGPGEYSNDTFAFLVMPDDSAQVPDVNVWTTKGVG